MAPHLNLLVFANLLLSIITASTLPSSVNAQAVPSALSNRELKELPLVKSRWLLRSVKGKPLPSGTIVTLEFPKAELGYPLYGLFKNNHYYSGVYTLRKNNHFKLDGCCQNQSDGPLEGTPEHDYILTLYEAFRYQTAGDQLSFFNAGNEIILQYRKLPKSTAKPDALYGKSWQLVTATTLENADLSAFTLIFSAKKPLKEWKENDPVDSWWYNDSQQNFVGTTACQNYEGSYFAVENMLAVSALDQTFKFSESLSEKDMIALDKDFSGNSPINLQQIFDLFCNKQDISAKDRYLDLLKNVWRYEVLENQLVLYSGQDQKLVFRQVKK